MKNLFFLIQIIGILVFSGCTKNIKISVESLSETRDSIIIKDLISKKPYFIFSTDNKKNIFSIKEPTVVSLESLNNPQKNSLLTILYPGKSIEIHINSEGILSSTNLSDSLLQYLFLSNNSFISENQEVIFSSNNPQKIFNLFSQLINERASVLKSNMHKLAPSEREILNFQNHARVYSFLFYYGRLIQNLEPENPFWAFIDEIDNNSQLNKSLPNNLLYKYEIEYLKKYSTINSISDFIAFIHENTTNKDLEEYLKAIYIKELISSPDYWQKHNQLFNSVTMHEILKKEENNPYNYIFQITANKHFASQQGMTAYNFSGISLNNETFQLSDFSGKYVMIDVWATWCGACVNQKPLFNELATKFKDNDDIQFVSISVDSSFESWQNYFSKNGNSSIVVELIVKNGMKTEFGSQYSINFIPKYILIDKERKIVDANIQNPSIALELILNKQLSKK